MKWKKMTILCIVAVLYSCGVGEGENLSKEPVEQAVEETAMDGRALYEQFLQGELSAVVGEKYLPNHRNGLFSTYILGQKGTCTLEEMEREVVDDYLHPKWPGAVYDPEAACASIQYAYVDNMDGEGESLLLRFNFDEQDQDTYNAPAYTVVMLAAGGRQLSVIGQYDNTVDNEVTAYENGMLYAFGSGSWNTESSVHALLSNGRCECIYERVSLSGRGVSVWKWESYLGHDIYEEVLAAEQEFSDDMHFNVEITTIYGDNGASRYFRYNMDGCTEQEKKVCEIFVNRCREEASITWVSEEEVRSAAAAKCKEIGIDFEKMPEPAEVVWEKLGK